MPRPSLSSSATDQFSNFTWTCRLECSVLFLHWWEQFWLFEEWTLKIQTSTFLRSFSSKKSALSRLSSFSSNSCCSLLCTAAAPKEISLRKPTWSGKWGWQWIASCIYSLATLSTSSLPLLDKPARNNLASMWCQRPQVELSPRSKCIPFLPSVTWCSRIGPLGTKENLSFRFTGGESLCCVFSWSKKSSSTLSVSKEQLKSSSKKRNHNPLSFQKKKLEKLSLTTMTILGTDWCNEWASEGENYFCISKHIYTL